MVARMMLFSFAFSMITFITIDSVEASSLTDLDNNGNTYVWLQNPGGKIFTGEIRDVSVYMGKDCGKNITEYTSQVQGRADVFQIDNRLIGNRYLDICIQAGKYSVKGKSITEKRLNGVTLE